LVSIIGSVMIVVAAQVSVAQAQAVSVTPFAGATFGGDAPAQKLAMGAALTFLGPVAGLEFEFGYSPDFFDQHHNTVLIGDNNVTTFNTNLVVGPKIGMFRPYGSAGVGLLRTRVSSASSLFQDLSVNDWGVNFGAGLIVKGSDHVGLRGDVRYFRSLQDHAPGNNIDLGFGTFDFWRYYFGVVLH
jgi:hypothetical protein